MPAAPTPPDQPRVLLVEDDRELRELLERLLCDAGYAVDPAPDGQAGLHRALTREYDVVVLDRGLPGIEGLDLLGRLRRRGMTTPVLILTAYGTLADRVAGLDAGAEDYLVKPFEVDELLARLRALRRRQVPGAEVIALGAGHLDLAVRAARRGDGTEVDLSGREMALLRILASRPRQVFSRDELRGQVFEAAESASIVDTYVHYLRRKLGNDVVRTVRGRGYRAGTL
ncbi:MAG: two-component system, OmpR family, response regulator QseB [Micromonosporaceae bacterium]|jgi:two-component system response regulator QseB